MLSIEEVNKIATRYLNDKEKNYTVYKVYDKPYGNIYWTYKYKPEELYFVVCTLKLSGGLRSSYCLLISKKDGKIIDFVSSNDEG